MESCSFTGHRPSRFVFQYNESHAACVALKSKLYHTIRALDLQKGIWQYFTGCALGADLWAGEAVLSLKEQYNMIKLICVVPFEGQDRNWSEPQRLRYSRLLANSNEVITLAKVARGAARSNTIMRETASSSIMLTFCSPFMIKKHIAGPGLAIQFAMPKGKENRFYFLTPIVWNCPMRPQKQTAVEIEAAFRFMQEAMGI